MSVEKARRLVLDRLRGGNVILLAVLLELPTVPAWCDGRDADGRAVCLVGKSQLGALGAETTEAVLAVLQQGQVPDGVMAVAYKPKASAAIAAIVEGAADEVLLDGPRESGKTQAVPGALAVLAELHARHGDPLPLQVIWLHDSLTNAKDKTGRSVTAPLWQGLWTLRDDSTKAVFAVGGTDLVHADFVGCKDDASQQRLRVECHVVAAEELIPSLEDAGGITEQQYELALSSMRLRTADDRPVRRYVAVSTTNPGDTHTWPYLRWIKHGGRPGTVRCPIPWSDRLTVEEYQKKKARMSSSPDLAARLSDGEWVGLKLGEPVAEGYYEPFHVAPAPLLVSRAHVLAIGWDGGHSPSAVIGQNLGGQVRIYASLNRMGVGVLEMLTTELVPWLSEHAPWIRQELGWTQLVHIIDPNLATPGQATITESGERMIRAQLGGRVVHGPVRWAPRREAVLRVLSPRQERGQVPLQIDPGEDTRLLRMAFAGKWYYGQKDERVDRTGPVKPNSPWADVGDAAAYLVGWLWSGDTMDATVPEVRVETEFALG